MPVRGLTLIVGDPARMDDALAIAAAHAAIGGTTRLYLHDRAVAALAAAPLDDALALGVRIIACQTGLAAAEIDLAAVDRRIEGGGLVGLLAALGEDRLVTL